MPHVVARCGSLAGPEPPGPPPPGPQVDVDFGFYCPQEKDFHGLRTLLAGYLDGQQWAASDLADAIIQQARTQQRLRTCALLALPGWHIAQQAG